MAEGNACRYGDVRQSARAPGPSWASTVLVAALAATVASIGVVGADLPWLVPLGAVVAAGHCPASIGAAAAPTTGWHDALAGAQLLVSAVYDQLGGRGLVGLQALAARGRIRRDRRRLQAAVDGRVGAPRQHRRAGRARVDGPRRASLAVQPRALPAARAARPGGRSHGRAAASGSPCRCSPSGGICTAWCSPGSRCSRLPPALAARREPRSSRAVLGASVLAVFAHARALADASLLPRRASTTSPPRAPSASGRRSRYGRSTCSTSPRPSRCFSCHAAGFDRGSGSPASDSRPRASARRASASSCSSSSPIRPPVACVNARRARAPDLDRRRSRRCGGGAAAALESDVRHRPRPPSRRHPRSGARGAAPGRVGRALRREGVGCEPDRRLPAGRPGVVPGLGRRRRDGARGGRPRTTRARRRHRARRAVSRPGILACGVCSRSTGPSSTRW